jgi:ABC-type transport system involved in multi-copper enzyme maturation permease subunit
MRMQQKLGMSYLVSLSITLFLAMIDSDPIMSYLSMAKDILFMSCIIWILIILVYASIYQFILLVKRASTK